MNLVPTHPGLTPNYWCTWSAQGAARKRCATENPTDLKFQGDQGAKYVRESLTEEALLGPAGWLRTFFPQARADLYAVLDDGWDVDFGVHPDTQLWKFGACEPSPERFPSFKGEPRDRLKAINEAVKREGWRGVGLWIAAQCVGDGKDGGELAPAAAEEYWRERARWCRHAGIEYWKVDWGYRSDRIEFRRLLTQVAREEAPGLLVEHANCMPPVNGDPRGAGRFTTEADRLAMTLQAAGASDVFRSYDVLSPLAIPSTLDRVYELLKGTNLESRSLGLLNTEDQVYMGGALGCALGVLRLPPFSTGAPLAAKLDEVTRAVRWQRIAPPFGLEQGKVVASERILSDDYHFANGETWYPPANNQTVRQGAPAIVARGLPLPVVTSEGEPPYVVASRHPNGATSVGTLARSDSTRGYHIPQADITIEIGNGESPVGVFGTFRSLSLGLTTSLGHRKIFAQDMAGEVATDITHLVTSVSPTCLKLEGHLIDQFGREAATPGDISDPGVIISIR